MKDYMELLNVNGVNTIAMFASWNIMDTYYSAGVLMLISVSVFNVYKIMEIIKKNKNP